MKVRGVLFDLGGTLLNYRREEVLRAVLNQGGIEVGTSAILEAYEVVDPIWAKVMANIPQEKLRPDSLLEQFDHLILEHLGLERDQGALSRFVRENWDRVDHQLPQSLVRRPFDDVLPCLDALRSVGMKMGIVSNIPSLERLEKEVEGLGLSRFFSVLVASGSLGVAKPNKRIFEAAAEKIERSTHDLLFVGDDLDRDYHGAMQADMKALLIDRSGKFKEHREVCRLASLDAVPKLLK
jgi:HAD superfamily hydrolase (TIGR01549 family)